MKYFQFLIIAIFFNLSSLAQNNDKSVCQSLINEGISLMQKREHPRSLELLVQAKILAIENQWHYESFLAINNIGANYHLMSDYGEAIKNYLEAYEIAIKKLEPRNEMTILNNIAILYFYERDYDKAYEFFLKAYDVAQKDNNSLKVGHYAVNLAMVANKLDKLDEAVDFINLAFSKVESDQGLLIQTKLAQIENLYLRGNYREAEQLLNEIYPQTSEIQFQEFRQMLLMIKADIHEKRDDISAAINFTLEASQINSGIENKIKIFESLSNLYGYLLIYDKALQYKDSVIFARKNYNESINKNLFESGKIKFEIQNYQSELAESKRRQAADRKLFYTITFSSVILMFFIVWNLWNISIKHKQRKKIAELKLEKEKSEKVYLEQQLKEKETLSLLEKEKLKNEIETKNRKLTAKALQFSSKNDLIEEIINAISKHPKFSKNEQLLTQVNNLKIHLKKETHWDDFFTHFEEVNKDFLIKLNKKHPDLSPGEIRFICYIYMNLTSKEIAALLNISNHSIRKRKERLAKKLQIPENQTLDKYISLF